MVFVNVVESARDNDGRMDVPNSISVTQLAELQVSPAHSHSGTGARKRCSPRKGLWNPQLSRAAGLLEHWNQFWPLLEK